MKLTDQDVCIRLTEFFPDQTTSWSIGNVIEACLSSLVLVFLFIFVLLWTNNLLTNNQNPLFLCFKEVNKKLVIAWFGFVLLYFIVFFNSFRVSNNEEIVNENHVILLPILVLFFINIFYEAFSSLVERITLYRLRLWLALFIISSLECLLGIDIGNYSQASFCMYTYEFSGDLEKDLDLAIYFSFALLWKYFRSLSFLEQICFFFPCLLSIKTIISIEEINKLLLDFFSDRKEGVSYMTFPGSEIVTRLLHNVKKEPVIIPKRPFYYNSTNLSPSNSTNILEFQKLLREANIPLILNERACFSNLAAQTGYYLSYKNPSEFNSVSRSVLQKMKEATKMITSEHNLAEIESINDVAFSRNEIEQHIENVEKFKKKFKARYGYYNELSAATAVRDNDLSLLNETLPSKEEMKTLNEETKNIVKAGCRFINQTDLIYRAIEDGNLSLKELLILFQDPGKENPFSIEVNDQLLPQQLGIVDFLSEERTYKIYRPNLRKGQGEIIIINILTGEIVILEAKVFSTKDVKWMKHRSIYKILRQEKKEPFDFPVLVTTFPISLLDSEEKLTQELKTYVQNRKQNEKWDMDLRVKVKKYKDSTWEE